MVPKASKTIMVYGAKVGGFDEGLGHGSYFKPAIKQHVLCTLCMSCYCLMLIAYAHCSIKSHEDYNACIKQLGAYIFELYWGSKVNHKKQVNCVNNSRYIQFEVTLCMNCIWFDNSKFNKLIDAYKLISNYPVN